MARTDQWIGLTDTATEFLDQLREVYGEDIVESKIVLVPKESTLCSETDFTGIQLTYIDKDTKSANSHYIIREKVQYDPWSSGPMYFTCLEHLCIKRLDGKEVMLVPDLFGWTRVTIPDFHSHKEYIDHKRGHMCV